MAVKTTEARAAIMEALQMIKEECAAAADCIECPFGNPGNVFYKCRITQTAPRNWALGVTESTWRAFATVPAIVFEEEPADEGGAEK